MKTLQEIFDQVTSRLLAQNRVATSNGHDCVYRAPNGDKCAAGHCLEDQYYSPEFERQRILCPYPEMDGVPKQFVEAFRLSGVDLHDFKVYRLLSELQRIHDSRNPSQWSIRFIALAQAFNLQVNFTPSTTTSNDQDHQ